MSTLAEVRLWGRTIGAVALPEGGEVASFEYDPEFAGSSIKVAPLTMPLSRRVFSFPELPQASFHGLPGLLADSLPDKFGNALINAWLAGQGRGPDSFNAVERLCYVGSRGMGALEYAPPTGLAEGHGSQVQVGELVELASQILKQRAELSVTLHGQAMRDILRVGTSAGGARAKAVIAWNPATGEVRSGQVDVVSGFEHWLIKFDGVSGNSDKELDDPRGYGAIEYAYSRMAEDAGINMAECRLYEENGRRHFMTRRFDRLHGGGKLHMQSLAALAHFDFNRAGAHSYEEAFLVMHKLRLPPGDVEQQFRRMAFNIVARNQDDHVKNIAFLMDRSGHWSLSPAYDLTYSYNPGGLWTSRHQMTMNGKSDGFNAADFNDCAQAALLKRKSGKAILGEVEAVVSRWRDYADEAGVSPGWRDQIQRNLRLGIWNR